MTDTITYPLESFWIIDTANEGQIDPFILLYQSQVFQIQSIIDVKDDKKFGKYEQDCIQRVMFCVQTWIILYSSGCNTVYPCR